VKIKEKLESFSKKVMAEAEEKNSSIMKENEATLQRELEEAEQREQRKADDAFRLAEQKAVRERERVVAAAELEIKKKLIARRSEMLSELFDDARRRLEEFVRSPGYADYLVNVVKPLAERYPGLSIRLRPEDMAYAPKIAEAAGVDVQPASDDFLGGFIAHTAKRGMLDRSFRSRLARECEGFNLELTK